MRAGHRKEGFLLLLLALWAAAAGWVSGRGDKAASEGTPSSPRKDTETVEDSPAPEGGKELSGSIRMAGSTSMERLANALAEGFMEKYPDVNVTVEFVGSGAGILAALSGAADIGNSSRELKQEEKDRGAEANIVAIDGIAVCTDPANEVIGLTRQQLADIYTGAVTSWSQVGGADLRAGGIR